MRAPNRQSGSRRGRTIRVDPVKTLSSWFDLLVAGDSGPAMSIAGFGETWADFADPDPSMEQVMTEAYGEDEAVEFFNTFSEGVDHWESFIVRHRPDLSGGGM